MARLDQAAADSPLTQSRTMLATASRIAAAQTTSLGRASAALKLVQQDVRYVYVGLNNGNLTILRSNIEGNRKNTIICIA